MNILVLNGSPRPNGNTAALVAAFVEGAGENDHNIILNYLKLENMGIFTEFDKQNKSEEKLNELRKFGQSLK